MAGGNEHTMQCRDWVFAAPFVIVDERQDRVPQGIGLLRRPAILFDFDRCDGHLPLARSD